MIKEQILAGHLTLPNINDMAGAYGDTVYKEIENMFSAMWHAYVEKGNRRLPNGSISNSISLPYWSKRVKHPLAMNKALKLLSVNGWITVSTRPNNNWSEAYLNESKLLSYVSQEKLDSMRMFNKYNKYKLTYHDVEQDFGANKMKIQGRVVTTDKQCNGFAKAGKVPFQFDTDAMYNSRELVLAEVNKGIDKMIVEHPGILDDHANYQEIGKEILESLMYEKGTYNAGPRTSDPRHRDNSGYLNKIGNPVGFKIMRGLLTIPVEHRNMCTPAGLINKYLFIAELVGFKSGSKQDKVDFGRDCYYNGKLSHCDVENIWLKRIYEDINNALDTEFDSLKQLKVLEAKTIKNSLYKWEVPIEIDMSASVLGFLGLLLNHKPFLARCNILPGDLTDAWGHDVITNRDQFKTIMRQCYGSQMTAQAMWDDMNSGKDPEDSDYMHYTKEEVKAFNHEMDKGDIAVAIAFKNFVIDNAQMAPVMNLHVLNHKVKTYCNKFHNRGTSTVKFDLYDTTTDTYRRIAHTETTKEPDLHSFKRYGPTGLIHGLDGNVMDNTVDATINLYGWALPIHDAVICCCESANYAREIYANGRNDQEPSLKYVHTNRNTILSNYFTSLNIPASKLAEWKTNVKPLVEPLTEDLHINLMVLK